MISISYHIASYCLLSYTPTVRHSVFLVLSCKLNLTIYIYIFFCLDKKKNQRRFFIFVYISGCSSARYGLSLVILSFQMRAVDFNPFSWDSDSKKVKSNVVSLDFQNGNGKKINVSNLDNDIEIVIPISSPATNISNATEHYFLKPNRMFFHSYYAELANVPVSMRVGVPAEGTVIKLFVKFGSRPTMEDSDYNFTILFTSTCRKQVDYQQNKSTSCALEERSVTIVPYEPSLLYVGLVLLDANNVTDHARKRRSCFGHSREKRSCVGVKEPPSIGVTKVNVPKYDPLTDVNYTFTITQSSCLYWSEDKEKWTSDGCKVRYINIGK